MRIQYIFFFHKTGYKVIFSEGEVTQFGINERILSTDLIKLSKNK